MIDFSQEPFSESIEFAENPESRCPCLLLLDTSVSMAGRPIAQLNAGLDTFYRELQTDSLAAKRVEIGIVTFGPVQVISDFCTPDLLQVKDLKTTGDTPMGAAINKGLDMIEHRTQTYKNNGIAYYRPWMFLITDGGPTDEWRSAATRIRTQENNKRLAFFAVGVEGARYDTLSQISVREPLRLQELRFSDLFVWLSNSLSSVSRSRPGDEVALASPSGWASV